MSFNVDVYDALDLLRRMAPERAAHDRALEAAPADVDDATLRDRALRAGLARLRAEVSRETFLYLGWKVACARREAQATREAVAAGRHARAAARAATAGGLVDPSPVDPGQPGAAVPP